MKRTHSIWNIKTKIKKMSSTHKNLWDNAFINYECKYKLIYYSK